METRVRCVNRADALLQLHWSGALLQQRGGARWSLRGLVHFFVDLLHRQLDVKLDAVEDILEICLLIDFKLQKDQTWRVCNV